MGLGQMLLSMLALAMLGTLLLSVNTNTADGGRAIEMSEYRIMAASLGISTLERATGLPFDETTISSDISATTALTSSLGRESGSEVDSLENTFDDFDDYNGFHKIVKGDSVFFKSADYLVRSFVDYVTVSGDSVKSSTSGTRTYNKRIRVYVTSPYMKDITQGKSDTLIYSTVYSYWYFR